jgi:hypothetical protein
MTGKTDSKLPHGQASVQVFIIASLNLNKKTKEIIK